MAQSFADDAPYAWILPDRHPEHVGLNIYLHLLWYARSAAHPDQWWCHGETSHCDWPLKPRPSWAPRSERPFASCWKGSSLDTRLSVAGTGLEPARSRFVKSTCGCPLPSGRGTFVSKSNTGSAAANVTVWVSMSSRMALLLGRTRFSPPIGRATLFDTSWNVNFGYAKICFLSPAMSTI